MLKRVVFKAMVLMLLIAMIGAKYHRSVMANPVIITVPSIGYETIQKAINTANPGDIIMVTAGMYHENLIVNKTVSLIGEDPTTTVIDGGGLGNVVIINSHNVIINGFTIQNGKQGDWPYCGISVFKCNFALINNTTLRDNYYGLQLLQSENSEIFNNMIINNSYAGIKISDSNDNVFFENIIENNSIGLWGSRSPSNIFYHNNFMNNTSQLQILDSPMIWDNGADGNYWGDYTGSDVDMDGIGDSKYLFVDNHPLMGMFTNFTFHHESQRYFLSTICNSTILNFQFDELHEKISFDVSGSDGTMGFCKIALPTMLAQGNCSVLVDGNAPAYVRNWTSLIYSYSYFVFEHSGAARKVTVTLEFPRIIVPPLKMVVTMIVTSLIVAIFIVAILIRRKKRRF